MDEKYKSVIKNIDKLPGKGKDIITDEEYYSLIKKIDRELEKKTCGKKIKE